MGWSDSGQCHLSCLRSMTHLMEVKGGHLDAWTPQVPPLNPQMIDMSQQRTSCWKGPVADCVIVCCKIDAKVFCTW